MKDPEDEIFNMAVKCYLISTGNREGFYGDALIQFAKLVAEAEREACAKVCETFELPEWPDKVRQPLAQAIRARGNT